MDSKASFPGYKRKHYFIKKEFQTHFILKFCVVILIGAVLSTGLLYFLSQETLTTSYNKSTLEIKNTALAILPEIILTNLITLSVISLAVIFVTMYISHRIAGPMYRFEQEIDQIAKGNLNHRITLREKDQMTEIAHHLNLMVENLQHRIHGIRERVRRLDQRIEENTEKEELTATIDDLARYIDDQFQL